MFQYVRYERGNAWLWRRFIGSFSTAICEILLDFACKQHQLYIFYVGKLTGLVGELAS